MEQCNICKNPGCPKCGTTHFISECIIEQLEEKKYVKPPNKRWMSKNDAEM